MALLLCIVAAAALVSGYTNAYCLLRESSFRRGSGLPSRDDRLAAHSAPVASLLERQLVRLQWASARSRVGRRERFCERVFGALGRSCLGASVLRRDISAPSLKTAVPIFIASTTQSGMLGRQSGACSVVLFHPSRTEACL